MVNRPAGGARSKRYEREEHDFYREPPWVVEQLFGAIDFGDDVIYDPCCGTGNILDVAKARGHLTIGSDIINRGSRHKFMRGSAMMLEQPPRTGGRGLSIVTNPPYSYEPDIAEKIIRRVIDHMPINKAWFLLPIAFLCSQERWRFFSKEFKPSHIAICSERPSMPPGSTVTELTEYKGGMADYIWLGYSPPHRWRTETIWLRPRAETLSAL